jgi:hypothetical protein
VVQTLFSLLLTFAVFDGLATAGSLFDLSDLSARQQSELWSQVEALALFENYLRLCGRPPFIEKKALEIADGCITPTSISTVVGKFREHLRNDPWSSAQPCPSVDCGGSPACSRAAEFENKIARMLSQARQLCALKK